MKPDIFNCLQYEIVEWSRDGIINGFLGYGLNFKGEEEANSLKVFEDRMGLRVALLNQIHSDRIQFITSDTLKDSVSLDSELSFKGTRPRADAWLADASVRGLALGILSADCVPVLIKASSSEKLNYFGAAHCGWKGTARGLLTKLISAVKVRDPGISEISIAIGPGAGRCCFQVGSEVVKALKLSVPDKFEGDEESNMLRQLFSSKAKTYIDLKEVLYLQARAEGIFRENIHISQSCTICDRDFYSFRRQGEAAGRQLSYIGLNPEIA